MPNRWTDDSQSLPFGGGSFESEKITNSEARSQSRMMRMVCRRNKTAAHAHRLVQQFFNEGHYGASLFER